MIGNSLFDVTAAGLNEVETVRLSQLEATISTGMQTFVDVGRALLEIRDGQLYRQEFGTFEDYCRDRWGIARRTAYQLIGAVQVVENVRHGAQTPLLTAENPQ